MPPYLSDFFRHGPEYNKGFEDGLKSAKMAAERRLKALIKELNALEPFPTYTATTSTSLEEHPPT